MTGEERQRTMDFILAQQAQFWASIQELEESRGTMKSRGSCLPQTPLVSLPVSPGTFPVFPGTAG